LIKFGIFNKTLLKPKKISDLFLMKIIKDIFILIYFVSNILDNIESENFKNAKYKENI